MINRADLIVIFVVALLSSGQYTYGQPTIFSEQSSVEFSNASNSFSAQAGGTIDHSLIDFHFVDESLGFVVGQYGLGSPLSVYRTTDGGQIWVKHTSEFARFPQSIRFKNELIGLISYSAESCMGYCGNNPDVLRTVDGGDTWTRLEYQNLHGVLKHLRFDSEGNAFAALLRSEVESVVPTETGRAVRSIKTNASLARSVDEGISWEVIYEAPDYLATPYGFELHGDTIFLLGQNGVITKVDRNGSLIGTLNTGYRTVSRLIVVSRDVLFARVSGNGGRFLIRSVDGGQTWREIYSGFFELVASKSADDVLMIVSKGQGPGPADTAPSLGAIYLSRDGGQSWEEGETVLGLDGAAYGRPMQSLNDTTDLVMLTVGLLSIRTGNR